MWTDRIMRRALPQWLLEQSQNDPAQMLSKSEGEGVGEEEGEGQGKGDGERQRRTTKMRSSGCLANYLCHATISCNTIYEPDTMITQGVACMAMSEATSNKTHQSPVCRPLSISDQSPRTFRLKYLASEAATPIPGYTFPPLEREHVCVSNTYVCSTNIYHTRKSRVGKR